LRAENYSDFGSTVNGKFAARYAFGNAFSLRGSISTGFRAPSLAQIYYNQIFTNVQSGVIFDALVASNVSSVARALGIPALQEEKATNASIGFTLNPFTGFSATVDGYWVKVDDRIVLTGSFDDSDPILAPILAEQNVVAAQFFTNAVNTTTMGVDIILNYAKYWENQKLQFSLVGNLNQLEIDEIYTNQLLAGKEDSYFGAREQQFLIYSAPPSKLVLGIDYGINDFTASLNINRWGELEFVDYSGNTYFYTPKITVDLTLGYDISNNVQLNIGASNLSDAYPDPYDPFETETGGAWDAVQMGFDGMLIFGKLNFAF
jgi:iron complex outermembrane receptor protein